jgi:hypothetical protein
MNETLHNGSILGKHVLSEEKINIILTQIWFLSDVLAVKLGWEIK